MIFATIGFALKAGLSLGSASFLWIMALCGYAANQPQTAATLQGIRISSLGTARQAVRRAALLLAAPPLSAIPRSGTFGAYEIKPQP